jgi:hypothetical protein
MATATLTRRGNFCAPRPLRRADPVGRRIIRLESSRKQMDPDAWNAKMAALLAEYDRPGYEGPPPPAATCPLFALDQDARVEVLASRIASGVALWAKNDIDPRVLEESVKRLAKARQSTRSIPEGEITADRQEGSAMARAIRNSEVEVAKQAKARAEQAKLDALGERLRRLDANLGRAVKLGRTVGFSHEELVARLQQMLTGQHEKGHGVD